MIMYLEYLKDAEYRRRLYLLLSTSDSIDIAVFSFTAAKDTLKFLKGKKVRIILDSGSRTIDDSRKVSNIRRLLSTVAEVRIMRDLHMKLFISNGDTVILGSMNLSKKSMWANHEAGVEIQGTDFVRDICAHFNHLWEVAK